MSVFMHVPLAPPNSIFGVRSKLSSNSNYDHHYHHHHHLMSLLESLLIILFVYQIAMECRNDINSDKIDLTIGAYRTNEGLEYVIPAV